MNTRRKIIVMAAALLLVFGLVAALISQPASVQVAGGWCGQSCADSVAPTPLAVAGGWCGQSCADMPAQMPTPTPKQ
jgi:hypothetical protein